MHTILHTYRFDVSKSDEYLAWADLRKRIKGLGPSCFSVTAQFWNVESDHCEAYLDGAKVELETKHLFDNQWNAKLGSTEVRLFDWYEGIYPNRDIKIGHWLEQTLEMKAIRQNTLACGYCGFQIRPAAITLSRRLPLYREAQARGLTERQKKQATARRKSVLDRYQEAVDNVGKAARERDGHLWWLDRGFNTDNLIYYKHTDMFAWGWRSAVSDSERSRLLDVISEFPFPYEIRCVDGKILSAT